MKPLKKHPNTVAAAFASLGIGSLVVQGGTRLGLHLDAQQGLFVAGVLASAALFVGRNGALGTYRFVKKVVLYGTGSSDKPAPARGPRRS
jgi:hypothetical protein